MLSNFVTAIILTSIAGLSTTFGSIIAIFYRKPGPIYMTMALGFSAGVMILVSFVDLLGSGIRTIGFAQAHIAFFLGLITMLCIDGLISHDYIMEKYRERLGVHHKLVKTSILTVFGIAIHNFPEGMATFAATLDNLETGVALAIAIAIHNIPEGIAISVPVYAATRSHKKAFFWSFMSGISEPVGAIVAAIILLPFLNVVVLHWLLCIVAGFMVYIAFDELLPVSRAYGREHLSIIGVILGMAVMTISLALI